MREVELRGFPLREGLRARQHRESLLREFAIIAVGGGERADVPKRLLEISKLHEERYAGIDPEADAVVDEAMRRGEESVDIVVRVPDAIRDDTAALAPVLLEVDEYCRNGDMLTLSPSSDVKRFWFWFLSEFVRQLNGERPTAWADFEPPIDL